MEQGDALASVETRPGPESEGCPGVEQASSSAIDSSAQDGCDTVSPNKQASMLTNENVTTHSRNGDNQDCVVEKEDDDNSSDLSELSDLSHECWQPVQGPIAWVQEQMRKGQSPRKILESLVPKGTIIPEGLDAMMLWKIIINIVSDPPKRKKLADVNTLENVLQLFRTCKKIMVLTGAGVSVSCGIPDFRSRDGVYARLAKDFPNLPDPQAMFDIHFFKSDPRPFFKFAKEIYPGQFKPSLCHHFIRLLESKGKLLRNYTQNIDTLEQEAGIERVIQCHGSFATATCAVCGLKLNSSAIKEDIFKQVIPRCPNCPARDEQAVMKPDIVFFGESLPEHFHNQMAADKEECDLLIVIGSSLKVRPVALIPNSLPAQVPQILINRERLHYLNFDVELLGDCDKIVAELCRRLGEGWDQLTSRRPLLDQVLLSNLPTPPASPAHTQQSNGGTEQVSSSSHSGEGEAEPSSSKGGHQHHHHHHHPDHCHGGRSPARVLGEPSLRVSEAAEEGVSSSSAGVASSDVDRLVIEAHKKDVVYEPSTHQGSASSSSSSSHSQHQHHHHHHSTSSSSSNHSHSHHSQHQHQHQHHRHSEHHHQQQQQHPQSSLKQGVDQHHPQHPSDTPSSPRTRPALTASSSAALPQTESSWSNDAAGEPQAKRQRLDSSASRTDVSRSEAGTAVCGEVQVADSVSAGCTEEEQIDAGVSVAVASSSSLPAEGSSAQPEAAKRTGSDDSQAESHDVDDLQKAWAERPRVSIAERLASNQMLFLPPSRYVFQGAEVYSDDSESEDDDDDDDDEHNASSEREEEEGEKISSGPSRRSPTEVPSSARAEGLSTETPQRQPPAPGGEDGSTSDLHNGASSTEDLSPAACGEDGSASHLHNGASSTEDLAPAAPPTAAREAGPAGCGESVECVVTSTGEV